MHVESFFTEAERREVEEAVRAAEQRSAGEIVPFVVARSDHYEAAAWKGALAGALLAALAAALVRQLADVWGGAAPLWIVAPAMLGAGLGFLAAAFVAPLTRRLAGAHVLDHRVRQRAAAAFLERAVFATRERTGVLIFLSLLERRVVVLADSGIGAKVEQAEWDGIVAEIVAGIRSGRPGKALGDAVRRCGELLARHGLARRADDTDELPDQLQMREE